MVEFGQQIGLLFAHEGEIERAASRSRRMAGHGEDPRVDRFGREREQNLVVGLDVPGDRHRHHHQEGDDGARAGEETPYVHVLVLSFRISRRSKVESRKWYATPAH